MTHADSTKSFKFYLQAFITKLCLNLCSRFRGPRLWILTLFLVKFSTSFHLVCGSYLLMKRKTLFPRVEIQVLAHRTEKRLCFIKSSLTSKSIVRFRSLYLTVSYTMLFLCLISQEEQKMRIESTLASSSVCVWQTLSGCHDRHIPLFMTLHDSLCLSETVSSNLLQTTRMWQKWWNNVTSCTHCLARRLSLLALKRPCMLWAALGRKPHGEDIKAASNR